MNTNLSQAETDLATARLDSILIISSLPSSKTRSRTLSMLHRVPLLSFFLSFNSSGLLELLLQSRFRISLARPPAALVRWYVLGLTALLQVSNGLQWMSFGPIANIAEVVFDWSDPVIMLLGGIGAAVMIPLSLPVAWFVEHIGERMGGVTSRLGEDQTSLVFKISNVMCRN